MLCVASAHHPSTETQHLVEAVNGTTPATRRSTPTAVGPFRDQHLRQHRSNPSSLRKPLPPVHSTKAVSMSQSHHSHLDSSPKPKLTTATRPVFARINLSTWVVGKGVDDVQGSTLSGTSKAENGRQGLTQRRQIVESPGTRGVRGPAFGPYALNPRTEHRLMRQLLGGRDRKRRAYRSSFLWSFSANNWACHSQTCLICNKPAPKASAGSSGRSLHEAPRHSSLFASGG